MILVDGYGIVLNDDEAEIVFYRALSQGKFGYKKNVLWEIGFEPLTGFNGTVTPIKKSGELKWEKTSVYTNDDLYFWPLDTQPMLYAAAYKDNKEAGKELKSWLKDYLPNFPFKKRICYISGDALALGEIVSK